MRKSYSRALSLVLAVLMLLSQMVFVATAEYEYIEKECTCDEATRTGEINYTKDPTCAKYGLIEFVCNECGGYYQELGDPPTGQHRYNVNAATCLVAKKCTLCNTVFEEKLGHDYSVDVEAKEATCTTAGYSAHKKCSRCSATSGRTTYAKLGHEWGEPVVDKIQECYAPGSQTATCTRDGCGATNTTPIPSYMCHVNYTVERIEATCYENAKAHHTCGACGFELIEDLTGEGNEPTNHADAEKFEGKAATCTEGGWKAYIVCDCGYTDYEAVDALGHDLKTNEVVADCSTEGYKQDVCQREGCGYVSDKYDEVGIDHEGHNLVGGDKTAPTCTTVGKVTAIQCTKCKKVLVDGHTIPALGHDLVDHEGQAATCTEKGWNAYKTCTRCSYTTYKEIKALGHVEGQSLGTVLPTCTEQGYDIWQCQRCLEACRSNYVDANGHTFDILVEAQAATCEEDGWEEHYKCSACDDDVHNYGENNELYIEALDHDIVSLPDTAPTCEDIGFDAYEYCTRCDYTTYDAQSEVPALGHKEETREVAETAEQVGYVETYCTVCEKVLKTEYVNDKVNFTYNAYGINGKVVDDDNNIVYIDDIKAVNSGYIYVDVYANVESAYARIWGVNMAIKYNPELTFVEANGPLFNNFVKNDKDNTIKFFANNGLTEGTEILATGEYLVATLTFKVDNDFYKADAVFEVIADECLLTRESNIDNGIEVDFGTGTVINVAMLGDSNENGKVDGDGADAMALYEWFLNADVDAYNYVFDMDKDGSITGDDYALLERATVGDNSYLEF